MDEQTEDAEREQRISMEIIVDAYSSEEQALSWWNYLGEHLEFPFRARCIEERPISPLRGGEEVPVTGMPPEDECLHEIFVTVEWGGREFGVPLAQLQGIDANQETAEAIADWHYWVRQGYQL